MRTSPGGTAISLPPLVNADILVLGDSFPFGTYVREEDTFPSLIERYSSRKVVNLAVGSQRPPEYNRMLEVGARFHPKTVLYCISANDFTYPQDFKVRKLDPNSSYQSLHEDRDLFVDSSENDGRLKRGFRRITNLSLTFQIFKLLEQPLAKFHTIPWRFRDQFYMLPEKAYWDTQVSWDEPDVQRGAEINLALISDAYSFSHSHLSANFLVVFIPSKEMTYAPYMGTLRDRIYEDSHHKTYVELGKQLSRKKIPHLDLTEGLRKRAPASPPLYHSIDGHFNVQGHREVADILYRFLYGSFSKHRV